MRIYVLALAAFMPFEWYPLWGQTKAVGVYKPVVKPPKRSTGSNHTGDSDQHGTKEFPLVVDTKGHQDSDAERAKANAEKQHVLDVENRTLRYARLSAWSSVVLSIVGLGGIIAAVCTLRQLSGQTVAARESAQVALLSAQAIQHSERAWITVLPKIWAPEFYPLWEPGDPIPADPLRMNPSVHQLPLEIKNIGKTPARIDDMVARYVRILVDPTMLPAEPEYGELTALHGYLLIPNDEIWSTPHLDYNDGMMTKSDVAAIHNQEAFLYVYGVVHYRDVFENRQEARFGFVYHFPLGGAINFEKAGFRQGGPPSYNQST